MRSLPPSFTWSGETSPGMEGLLHAGFLHIRLLLVGSAVALTRANHPTVLAHGIVATKSTWAVASQATAATVWRTLHPKITSQSWAAGQAIGGRHSIHGGRIKKNHFNRRRRKGVIGGGAPDKGHGWSLDHRPAIPYHRVDPPSQTSDEANPNPNRSGYGSPPWLSPLGNRIIRWVIRLPTSTHTRPTSATQAPSPTRVLWTQQCGESGSATRNRDMGRGGEDVGPLDGVARATVAVVVGGLGGCLDPMATGSYGGSRATREEKTARRRNWGPTRPPVQARWKKTGMLGLGFNPNRHNKKKTNKIDQAAIRSGAGKAQRGFGRRRLASTISITGARVEAHIGILKKKGGKKKQKQIQVCGGDHDPTQRS
jgi:hypothetical protein